MEIKRVMEAKELDLLKQLANSQKLPARIVKRSKVLSFYLSYKNKRKTSKDLGISRDYIYRWVNRWEKLEEIRKEEWKLYKEGELIEGSYKKFIIKLLGDKKRSGTSATFTELEKNKIVTLALMNPLDIDLPFTHWTAELLRKEVIKRGIVKNISSRHVSRILKKSAVMSS